MRISRAFLDEIVAHAVTDAPNECCGMVAATDGAATEVFRAKNEMASPYSFNVDPRDLFRIVTLIEDRGEELGAIYHSHAMSAAVPSQADINMAANWPDPLWVICSLADREAPEVRAWAIRDGGVEEVELVVE